MTLETDRQEIMRAIETRVQLPARSSPIQEYSRNYVLLSAQKILAVFVLPHESIQVEGVEDFGCERLSEIDENGEIESSPCTASEIDEIREMEEGLSETFGKANESRWFKSSDDLPHMEDGGCSQINIIFDLRLDTFEQVECNGGGPAD